MHKKLTITVDEEVYKGLHTVVGRTHISDFIEKLVRPHVLQKDLSVAYKEMAADEMREQDAFEWSEAMIGDISDEAR